MKKFFICYLMFLFVSFSVFTQSKAKLTKVPDAMFWQIDSVDKNGKPSKVYILGTIHIGDERLFPIPEVIKNAWDNSDTIVSEISSEDIGNVQKKLNSMLVKSISKTAKLKRNLENDLTAEEIEILKTVEGFSPYFLFYEPWVLNQVVTLHLANVSKLSSDYSYDTVLMQIATESNIKVEGLEDIQIQLDIMNYGDWDLQLEMLKSSIAELKEPTESLNNIVGLYESYLSYDEEKMTDFYITNGIEKEIEKDPTYKGYFDALLVNRNIAWAEKIHDYLENGGTVFIFAGSGHFLGKDSVFEQMRKQGYLF